MQKNRLKNEKGITLVTLVITIIVLLILAGISLTGITGNNGLTQKSADAKNSAEVKSEMNLIEVASNSARGKNRYGNISADNLQKELNISAGNNKTEVEEELDENDKIGYKITFLDSKRYYFVYNEGEDAEILFIGIVDKDTSKGIIHANPRRKKVNINTSEKVKILLRVFSSIDNNKINLSYGWSKSSYKEPDSYIDVTVDGTGNDKTTDASYPNETGDWYLFVKARINNEEEMLKVFGKYSVVAENVSTSTQKYTVIYEKGENVLSIGARYDTTTGEIKLPSITTENGYKDKGWYENDEYVGNSGTTITINRNLTLTAEAQDSKAPMVKITREDYNTFSWEAKDKEKITGYIITKSEKEPSIEDSGWKEDGILTSGTHDIDSASTYYVYVRDDDGNIGKASIDAYLVTRNQGTGTTLITRVDGASNETGTSVTDNIAVLNNTKIYVEASATDGHTDVTINAGTKDVTNPGIITIQKNTTISSHAESKELILAFDANGGTGTMPNQTIVYGTATNLSANTFTKTGYTFTGWNTKADGSGTSYTDGQSILITNEETSELKTLYAQWTENSYTIVFNKNNPNATGTMANMSMTYGTAKALTSNAFAVTTTGITSKQIFNGWNTKVDGSGTSYANEASVNNLTTTAGGTVTLYAQWVDANYEISSPVAYTLKIQDALETAKSSATIKVLKSVTDNSTAIVNKTLTLNLNAKTLTRNDIINITYGAFTLNGSADGNSVGMLNYTNSSNAAIYNSGTEASFTIQNKTHLKTIGVGIVADGNTTKDLLIKNSWINETGNKNAIAIAKAKDLIIQDSWVYADYGDNSAIYVNVLANLRFCGYSRIGGGNKKASTTNSLITFTNASQSQVTNLNVADHSIVMSGPYNRETVLANRAINASITGEAEMYAQNGSCFTHWANGSNIYINTSGWVYAKGYYVVDASGSGRTVTANFPRGTLVASSKNMVIQGTNTYSGTSPGGTHDHDFYIMTAYNSYTTKRFTGLYEYGNGFVKVGNSSTYRWRYLRYGSQYTGWQQINGAWYYFWKSSDSPQLESGDTDTYMEGMMVRKWVKVGGKWFYLTPSSTNEDPTVGNHGKMHTGMLWINGKRYYLAPYTGFKNNDGKEFEKGEMVTGLCTIDGKNYYFNPATGISE